MPSVIVSGRLPGKPAPPPRQPVFVLADVAGRRLALPFAPLPTSHAGFGWAWEVVERAGRTPLLLRAQRNLKTLAFTLVVANRDYQQSIDAKLANLEALAAIGGPFALAYSRAERGLWRLVDCSYDVTRRAPGSNAPTRATVSLTFTQASDRPSLVGPPPRPRTTSKRTPATPTQPAAGTYTVRAGDTLAGIAARLYGAAYKWPEIADRNGIRDPRSLRVGQVLRLP